jgi:arylsulfatase A
MNRRNFLSMLGAAPLAAQDSTKRTPNVILVLLDDLGWRDFGIYGSKYYETPELDRLGHDGVRFTQAYAACPVCSPTRASIMTGKYPARRHLTDWIPGRKQWPASKLLRVEFEQQLPLAETTIAEILKPLGYRTGSIGKWHLGGGEFTPDHQGFDVSIGGNERGGLGSFFGPFPVPGLEKTTKGDYISDVLTSAAEKFIEASAQAKQPFFLYMPHYLVHIPLNAKAALIDKYKTKFGDVKWPDPVYAAMVEHFDQSLGRVRKKLDQLGIAQDTIIIVTSDNGGLRNEGTNSKLITDNSPLRAGKGHLYEGGIREPLIVYWPGVTKSGTLSHAQVCSIDLLPTIAEMADARAPKGIDGKVLHCNVTEHPTAAWTRQQIVEAFADRDAACPWRIQNHAAIGVWYSPRQCLCQRYGSMPNGGAEPSPVGSGRRPARPA